MTLLFDLTKYLHNTFKYNGFISPLLIFESACE